MDIGNYERFLNQNIPKNHNITTSTSLFNSNRIRKKRRVFGGMRTDYPPHITDEIKNRIKKIARDEELDFLIVECGGTVGDIESLPFLEALRQMRVEDGPKNVIFVHVTLAPSLDVVGEQKTKPTQHSVQELRRIGIQPDFLAVRCTQPLEEKTKKKLALFTNVTVDDVLSCHDAKSIFEVPQMLYDQGILDSIFTKFGKVGMVNASANWDDWNKISESMINQNDQKVKIAMVGKYVTLADSYVSVNHALKHAGAHLEKSVDIDWIDSESIDDYDKLSDYDGILVPGGFGIRGSEGIIKTSNYAREKNIPYLGICFGFQLAAIGFGRTVLNLEDANSAEIKEDSKNPVVDLLPEQKGISDMGGSLRLGGHKIKIKPNTMAQKIYASDTISKRHRHRYEINKTYIPEFEKNGMIFSAESDDGKRMEILEIPNHKFYLGVQFHPEFNSRPGFPEKSFISFVKAASS